ncbi:cadmium resistance transporter [Methanobacterium spitsbergense]|uniref:Cadmium resistance transporter n=1 Tax=Methanobacterium spitsbergense TaxID=2874285 RepID=A0A8T5V016_9EURY|nr:cadmium resistance transporter [Methanobacterium spitsbergense]MBZ2165015.1 cadmium resistance transporter [Methanobacterium spitsbergense]
MEIILTCAVAVTAFIATNLDDMFILIYFFTRNEFNKVSIVLGQYIGISVLILISMLAYFFKFIIPPSYIALLGIFPIVIGLNHLCNFKKNSSHNLSNKINYTNKKDIVHDNSSLSIMNILKVATVTFSNGGDNIGVYAPLFVSLSISQIFLTSTTFLVMVGIWCIISYIMVINKIIGYKLQEYGHIILPFVLIIIGIGVLTSWGSIFPFKV